MTSFRSTPGQSQETVHIESANTSFGSDMVGQKDGAQKDGPFDGPTSSPWGSSMRSLPPELDTVITNRRLSQDTSEPFSTNTCKFVEASSGVEPQGAQTLYLSSGGAVRTHKAWTSGSSATTETVSTAERNAMYDATDRAMEQHVRPSKAYSRPNQAQLGHTATTATLENLGIQSSSPTCRQKLLVLALTTAATHEMIDSKIDSPLSRLNSEDFRLTQLPRQHLFIDESIEPSVMSKMSFKTRYECSRVALASGLAINDFASEAVLGINKYDELWSYFKKIAQEKGVVLPKRSSAKAWDDPSSRCEYMNLKAKVTFNDETNSRQSLFQLHIDPIELDKPCRFQHAYGGDRFLYLFLPDLELKDEPSYLTRAQKPTLIYRLQQWLDKEKCFLGRIWEVIHVEAVKEKSKVKRKERKFSYRIILFATKGYDILPKMAMGPVTDYTQCLKPSSRPETTIEEIMNWFMPLLKTSYQPYCKAFARLDLGICRTAVWPTPLIPCHRIFKDMENHRLQTFSGSPCP